MITLAQAGSGNTAANASSVSKAFASNVALNNLVVITTNQYPAKTYVQGDCAKSAGTATLGTMGLHVQVQSSTSQDSAAAIYSALITGAGPLTMQQSAAAGSYINIGLDECVASGGWDATAATRLEDSDVAINNTGSTTPAVPNMTSAGGAIFFGSLSVFAGAAVTIGLHANYTLTYEFEDAGTAEPGSMGNRITATGLTDAPTWTLGTSYPWVCCGVVLKEAAGGGGGLAAGVRARLLSQRSTISHPTNR